MYDLSIYDDQFYDTYGDEGARMAPWFMPLLRTIVPFNSLIDFGCGEGWYVKWCEDHGMLATGVEGSPAALRRAVARAVICGDLRSTPELFGYDVALSLEVAEHIEPDYVSVFVDHLVAAAPVVVMTAAKPGQGGLQHVNEQPDFYWIRMFGEREYRPDLTVLSQLINGIHGAVAEQHYCAPWLVPNLMVFRRV